MVRGSREAKERADTVTYAKEVGSLDRVVVAKEMNRGWSLKEVVPNKTPVQESR